MAEVIGLAASVVQLLSCIQQLRTFYKAMRDIPQELQATLDEIEVLQQVIAQIATIDRSHFDVSGDGGLLTSLERCKATSSDLQAIVTRTIEPLSKKGVLRAGSLVKAVLRKGDIKELKQRLDAAKSDLHLAVTCYTALTQRELLHMQQEQTSMLRRGLLLPSLEATASTEHFDASDIRRLRAKRVATHYPTRRLEELCRLKRCCCACHDTITIQSRSWPLKFTTSTWFWKTCDKTSCRNAKGTSIWFSLTPFGIRKAVCISLDFNFSSEEIRISPSLGFPRVVRRTSPGFTLLWELETGQKRDWPSARQELLQLFESGQASPRDIDPDGNTWLEKLLRYPWYLGSRDIQFSLLHQLANMGTQLNTPGLMYESVNWIGEGPHLALLEDLLYLQFDLSEIEAPCLSLWPKPCSSGWIAVDLTPDPFFVEWISKSLEICPGESNIIRLAVDANTHPGFGSMSPLLEAILTDSVCRVTRLLSTSPLHDQDNLLGFSVLHLAVYRPQHLKALLEAGADVNARDCHGLTPLMHAAAMGESDIAIQLLENGADPKMRDTLWHRNFLEYAQIRGNWNTIMSILEFYKHSTQTSGHCLSNWLRLALFLWVYDKRSWQYDSSQFQRLLEWGADTNAIIPDLDFHSSLTTLAHKVSNAGQLKELISHGFTRFNQVDREGNIPLLTLWGPQHDSPNLCLIELMLEKGSYINHQNHHGNSCLHIAARELRSCKRNSQPEDDAADERRSRIIDSIELLLKRGADPCTADCCNCYCSRGGCKPSNTLLDVRSPSTFDERKDVWILEYLDKLQDCCGPGIAKRCVIDILRFFKFQELDLTHTCLKDKRGFESPMEADEIKEIQAEEIETIELLEQEMQIIEESLQGDLEQCLISAICIPMINCKMQRRMKSEDDQTDEPRFERYEVDYWRDQFTHHIDFGPNIQRYLTMIKSDTMGLQGYTTWVDYQHSQNQKAGNVDEMWYKKRLGWISRIRGIEEEAEKAASETVVSEPAPLIISTF